MKKRLLSFITAILAIFIFFGCTNPGNEQVQNSDLLAEVNGVELAADNVNVPSTKTPPGGLENYQTPQFVSFGFDDNGYLDSLIWVREMLKRYNNNAGTGNAATYDGQTAKATFFMTGTYLTTQGLITANNSTVEKMQAAVKGLYDDGNEIGNHTFIHTDDKSVAELTRCNDAIIAAGIPASEIYGFRSPNLHYNDASFSTLYNMGFLYDCTIEDDWDSNKTGEDDLWPYTLDNGSPTARLPVSNYPGMWELPVFTLHVVGQDRIETAFDYNLWVTRKLTKEEFLQTLKNSLDARLAGNRAPMTFGTHADEYSAFFTSFENQHTPNSNWDGRRWALEEFVKYAISKPQVRIVTHKQIIDWMKNPQPLAGDALTTPIPSPTPTPDPSIPAWDATKVYLKGDKAVYGGAVWEAQWWTQNQIPGSPEAMGAWVKK